MKVLLWNGGYFFVDDTELRFYLRMAVNYRGNLFDNIGSCFQKIVFADLIKKHEKVGFVLICKDYVRVMQTYVLKGKTFFPTKNCLFLLLTAFICTAFLSPRHICRSLHQNKNAKRGESSQKFQEIEKILDYAKILDFEKFWSLKISVL
jgi:hypothetical protein